MNKLENVMENDKNNGLQSSEMLEGEQLHV